jgi:hypothetical protein
MTTGLLWIACGLAVVPTALIVWNLRLYRPPGEAASEETLVSVLIPARNEEAQIEAALEAVLASRNARLEVLVLDDHSTDATAACVGAFAARDSRVKLLRGLPLPSDACGKPFACAQLADAAAGEILLFVDADVRLSADAVGRIAGDLERSNAALSSGVPRQITGTISEKLLVPLIHFVLLGYLPIAMARSSTSPAFGAACGQLVAAKRAAYFDVGGHRSVLTTFHDGVALARRFRACGYASDLIDVTALAQCRMYTGFRSVLAGLAKNAHEGLGSPRGIVPWTVLLLGGQVFPAVALLGAAGRPAWVMPAALAVAAAYSGRLLLALRFEHAALGVALHPLGIAALVAVQWYALMRRVFGRPVRWKDRLPSAAQARRRPLQ